MYISKSKTEQGSALGEITEIKRERKLLNSGFLTNILSNVSQSTGREYMQSAQRIDARYLGVVVWKLRNLGSTIEKSKKCLKNVENVLFLALFQCLGSSYTIVFLQKLSFLQDVKNLFGQHFRQQLAKKGILGLFSIPRLLILQTHEKVRKQEKTKEKRRFLRISSWSE